MAPRELPTGTITFLFTDIEASTQLFEQVPERAIAALARHDAIIERDVAAFNGIVVRPRGEGDSRFVVFAQARNAVAAAVNIQQALFAEPWDTPWPLKVRMALHTGDADLRQGDYYGSDVNRCARLRSIGNGGQTLLSGATFALVQDDLPPGVTAQDQGEHRLKDLTRPEHVYQLVISGIPQEFHPLRSLSVFPNNLPVQVTEFIGRQEALHETRQSLETGRLLTIVGPGGIGKSRLAIEVGAEFAERFRHGVFFIPLARVSTADAVAQAIAEGIGLSLASGDDPRDQLLNYLRVKQLLLILDNFEHVINAAGLVEESLLAAPEVKILVTSRIKLSLSGETVYGLLGLKSDSWQSPESAKKSETVQLFISTARQTNAAFELKPGDLPSLQKIVELVQGSPLGLLLSASWIDLLPLQEIAAEIEQNLDFLTTEMRDIPERQHSMRAVFETTWRLLNPEEQDLFIDLSIFQGGFTRHAAQEVAGASLHQLAILASKSLLVMDSVSGRYSIHELLRQYGEESLKSDSTRYAAVQKAHALHFAGFMDTAWGRLTLDEQPETLTEIELDIENIRAGWGYLTTQGDPQEALRMIRPLFLIYEIRGWHLAGAEIFETAMHTAASRPPDNTLRILFAMCNSVLSHFKALISAVDEALLLGEKAIDELRTLNVPEEFAFACRQFCLSLQFTAQTARMREVCLEGLAASDEQWNAISLHSWLSHAEQLEGHKDEAEKHILIAEALLAPNQDYYLSYFADMVRYISTWEAGDVSLCQQILEKTLIKVRLINFRRATLYSLQLLSAISMALKEYPTARRYLLESLKISEETGSTREKLSSLVDLGHVLAAEGPHEQALEIAATAHAHPLSYQNVGWNMAPIRSRAEELRASLVEDLDPDRLAAAWNQGLSADFDVVVTELIESRPKEDTDLKQ